MPKGKNREVEPTKRHHIVGPGVKPFPYGDATLSEETRIAFAAGRVICNKRHSPSGLLQEFDQVEHAP
jgi:hypothetical protein